MLVAVLAGLFAAAAINSALPGPVVMFTFGRSSSGGLRAGLCVVLGVALADVLLLGISLGVMFGALAVAPVFYAGLKWGGIVVLLVLAVQLLRAQSGKTAGADPAESRDCGDLIAGVLVGLSSPHNLFFLLALLPQYTPQPLTIPTALAVGAAVVSGGAAVLVGVAIAGLGSRGVSRNAPCWIGRAASASLVFFAGAAVFVPPG